MIIPVRGSEILFYSFENKYHQAFTYCFKQLFYRFEVYAESITREAKRGIVAGGPRRHDVIDEDMLPSSDNDDDEYDMSGEDEKNSDSSADDFSDLAGSFQSRHCLKCYVFR